MPFSQFDDTLPKTLLLLGREVVFIPSVADIHALEYVVLEEDLVVIKELFVDIVSLYLFPVILPEILHYPIRVL